MFWKKRVYLDFASATPIRPCAQKAFDTVARAYGNPSSPHEEGRHAKEILEAARLAVARMAEVKPASVIFTSGATESNALAILGTAKRAYESGVPYGNMHFLYSPMQHASVLRNMEMLERLGASIEAMPLVHGTIDLHGLKRLVRKETMLVSMDAVCGETGTRFNTRQVAIALTDATRAHGSEAPLLHVDASQLPVIAPFELTRLSADMLTLDAQKVGGVRGIGALIARRPNVLAPLYGGGGQEFGLRPGTESPTLAAAFAAALTEAAQEREAFMRTAKDMQAELITILEEAQLGMQVNMGKESVPHILNVSFPGRDTDYAAMLLVKAGYAVSTKSACETDADGSYAVLALTSDAARSTSTLRISWGSKTSKNDMKRFAKSLIRTIRFLDMNLL